MREYIAALISVSIICSIASFFVAEGAKKQIGFVCALCILCVTLSPAIDIAELILNFDIGDIASDYGDPEEYESIFDGSVADFDRVNTEMAVSEILNKRFNILHEDCRVSVTLSSDRSRVDRIFIRLYGGAVWADTGKIEEYFESLLGCEVVTAVG